MKSSTASAPIGAHRESKLVARRRDRSTEAYEQLRQLIITGQLAPGTRITELDLAGRLGVSRTPARAALQRLGEQGYVLSPNPGKQLRVVVSPLTADDARELYAIVGELEGLAVRWAARLPPPRRTSLVQELQRINDEIRRLGAAEAANASRVFELDMVFHRCYVRATDAPRLHGLHDSISAHHERYVRLYASTLVHHVGAPVGEHARIVQAIRRGSPTLAQEAVRTHYGHAIERLSAVIHAVGERGNW
jgi:GntR family transcriptional regulator, rspAB operon transcriptional repressor